MCLYTGCTWDPLKEVEDHYCILNQNRQQEVADHPYGSPSWAALSRTLRNKSEIWRNDPIAFTAQFRMKCATDVRWFKVNLFCLLLMVLNAIEVSTMKSEEFNHSSPLWMLFDRCCRYIGKITLSISYCLSQVVFHVKCFITNSFHFSHELVVTEQMHRSCRDKLLCCVQMYMDCGSQIWTVIICHYGSNHTSSKGYSIMLPQIFELWMLWLYIYFTRNCLLYIKT